MALLLAFSCASKEAAEAVATVLEHWPPWEGEQSPRKRVVLDLAGKLVNKAVGSRGASGGGLLTAAVARTLHAMSERQAGRSLLTSLKTRVKSGLRNLLSQLWLKLEVRQRTYWL